ncbi:Tat pathway signal sequence [Adlercreutzia murintestinalis]|uniref:Tat pathway signal sequence n=1 Tax=Adlercreutzia murintestinalis TaxID=2941325 RepID=UPI00203D78E2|nr:Tat pathway signal sequence [Adlercreutzia murintestinalis]
MAKSGLDSLLEALRASGMDTDGMGGGATAEGAGSTSGGERAQGSSSRNGSGKGETPHLDLSFLDNMKGPSSKKGWIILAVVAVLVLAALYWWFHPPISINSVDLWMLVGLVCVLGIVVLLGRKRAYESGVGKAEKSPSGAKRMKMLMIIPGAIIAVGLLGALFSNAIIPGNAEKYSNVLKTDTLEFAEDIQEANYSEIPVIDRNSAILLGNREMGTIPEYVSQFEVSDLYSQINFKGEPVRVSPLGYADLFKWFTNRESGIPAYSLVNMTTQDSEIVRLGDNPIYYSQSEPLARNIDRYVQLKYPFYIFDELSFEIDEEGHAWWICPVRTYTIGLFGGYTINRVVLCDATTGECTDLTVEEVPQWVDRVYPAELLIEQYNWYGSYHNGWLNSFLGQEGVVRTTPGTDGAVGYNYIAKDDDVWVYTGVTSATADDSIIGFVLVNQRTQEAHFYSVAGATESSAMQSAEGQVQNLRYTATFPLLINVANQPTYFMALKDGAGLVKKFAMVDIQRYQNVAVGDTVAETQTAYEALLATNGVVTDAADLTDVDQVSGRITKMAQAVVDGNSHFYVTIEGRDELFDFGLPGLLEIIKYDVGDSITFTFLSTEGQANVYSIVGPDGVVTATGENDAEGDEVDAEAVADAAQPV